MPDAYQKIYKEEDIFSVFLSILEDVNQVKKDLESKNKDLSDQRRAALNILEDLEGKKNQIESILNSISEGLVMMTKEADVIFTNPSAENLLAIKKSEIQGENFYNLIKIDKGGGFINPEDFLINQCLDKKISFNVNALQSDFYFTNRDGKRFLVAFNINPTISGDKKFSGAIFTFWDATSERELDQLKSEFVSVASHQLRTPLTATKWLMEMLISGDSGKLNSEQLDVVHQAYTANERMIDLVNALLNVSRIEAGHIIPDFKITNIIKLIEELFKGLKPIFSIKKQKLILDFPASLPQIKIDPKLFNQIFTNLLSNANKYSPDNSQIIFKAVKSKNEILFQVSDNGYGIPKAEQGEIFKKFFRASNALLKEPEGNGLGLYIIKSMVELLHGKIWFDSEENKGTNFYVSLPIEK